MGRPRSQKAKTPESALIGRQMLRAMQQADLVPAEIAERVGRRMQTVNKWLNGFSDPSPADMEKFAAVVGKPVSYFFIRPGEAEEVTETVMHIFNEVLAGILAGEKIGDALAAGLGPYGELPSVHRDLLNRMTGHLRRVTPAGDGQEPLVWGDLSEPDRQALVDEIRQRQSQDGRGRASPRSRGRSTEETD